MTDDLLPARPDHEQIIISIGNINADLPTSFTIHFTTSPSHPWLNSCHQLANPLSQICLLVFGIPQSPRAVISMCRYWANMSRQQQQPSRSSARRFSFQIAAILSTFWHQCRFEINQYSVLSWFLYCIKIRTMLAVVHVVRISCLQIITLFLMAVDVKHPVLPWILS